MNGVLDETDALVKASLVKASPPFTIKRGIQDSLEGLEELAPKKRRCANIKNKETVEAGVQPRRGQ